MVRVQVNDVRLWCDVLAPQVVLEQDQLVERPTVIGVHGGPGIDSTFPCSAPWPPWATRAADPVRRAGQSPLRDRGRRR